MGEILILFPGDVGIMYYLENYHFKAGLLVEKMASFGLSIIQFEGHIQFFYCFALEIG